MVLAVAMVSVWFVAPAGASVGSAALPSGCSEAAGTVTCSFTSQGETGFVVPQGVGSVTASVVGAQGGADYAADVPGGLGAQASGVIAVTSGETLYAEVDVLGGANGVDDSGIAYGGPGGGESDVRTCSASATCATGTTLSSRLLVAGGGGGTGTAGAVGGNAGTTGTAGNGVTFPSFPGSCAGGGGTGASTSAAGSGGAGGAGGSDGADGDPAGGAGGAGGNSNVRNGGLGGGGGGGWFGGGGGGGCGFNNVSDAVGGGGGGGSSYAAPVVSSATFSQAVGGEPASVSISYTAPPVTVTNPGNQTTTAGTPVSLQVTASDSVAGQTLTYSATGLPDGLSINPGTGLITGTPTTAGTSNVTVTATDTTGASSSATFTWTVNPRPAASLSITNSGSPNPVVSGHQLTYTITATNTGGQDATDTTVTDALPATVHFDSSSSSQGTCTRTTTNDPKPKSGAVSCALGTLAAGSSATITIVVTPTTPGTISAVANVAAPDVTANGNETATATDTVLGT